MQDDKPQYTTTEVPEWFQQSTPAPSYSTPEPRRRHMISLPWRQVKRALLIVAVIAIPAVLIVSYFAYQSPDKVLADGLNHLLNAQQLTTYGTITAEDDNFKITTTLNATQNKDGTATAKTIFESKVGADKGKVYTVTFDAQYQSNGSAYVKVGGLSVPLKDFLNYYSSYYGIYSFYNPGDDASEEMNAANDPTTYQTGLNQLVDQLAAQIDGRWIEVAANSGSEEGCRLQAYSSLAGSNMSRELLDEYNSHHFLSLKNQTTKDGNFDFVMNYDTSAAQELDLALQGTSLSKKLTDCESKPSLLSIDSGSSGFGMIQNGTLEVVTDQWSHNIQMLNLKGAIPFGVSKIAIDVNLRFAYAATKPAVTAPSQSTSIDEIEKSVQPLQLSLSAGD